MVGQGAERLVAQCDLGVEPPRLLGCERGLRAAAPRSRSIDAAHPVDGDLLDQELVDVLFGQLLGVLGVSILCQHPDLLWAKAQPIPGPRTAKIGWCPTAADPRHPSPLRPAPPRASTPLPASFGLTEDASTQSLDGGSVLLGGSPLRLFRISERARGLVARWRAGAPVGAARPAQLLARRLVSAGAFVAAAGTTHLRPR